MGLSEKTKKIIWGQFAGRCAICKEKVIHENEDGNKSLFGEVAHIIGEKNGSARFSNRVDIEYRNSEENLMLLCANHHTVIDKDENVNDYRVEKLHQIKDEYLNWLESSLSKSVKWDVNLAHLFYLNIPRLNEVALKYGYKVNLQKYNERQNLHSHGWDLNYIMLAYEKLFKNLRIDALDFNRLSVIHESFIGRLVYFERIKFRTKNIDYISGQETNEINYNFTGDLKKDPHIYFTHYNGWKLVLNINRNWVTTDTAFSYFRPSGGVSTFSGFFRIINVDYSENIIFGSPFTIGLTPSPWDNMVEEKHREGIKEKRDNINVNIVEENNNLGGLVDFKKAKKRAQYFDFADQTCDFCKRILANDKYMIDGGTYQGPWAYMCVGCFEKNGYGIEWGVGQLFQNLGSEGWLLVAGYDKNENAIEDNFENYNFKEFL